MRFHFNKRLGFAGYSDNAENVFAGAGLTYGFVIMQLVVAILAPLVTYLLILLYKNKKEVKETWNPYRHKISFVILNIAWLVWLYAVVL